MYVLLSQSESESAAEAELRELKESLADTPPVGALVKCARTLDQVRSMHMYKYVSISCMSFYPSAMFTSGAMFL